MVRKKNFYALNLSQWISVFLVCLHFFYFHLLRWVHCIANPLFFRMNCNTMCSFLLIWAGSFEQNVNKYDVIKNPSSSSDFIFSDQRWKRLYIIWFAPNNSWNSTILTNDAKGCISWPFKDWWTCLVCGFIMSLTITSFMNLQNHGRPLCVTGFWWDKPKCC